MREIRTSGLMSGDGKRDGGLRQHPRPSSTLPRVRREAVETGVDTRSATEGPGDVVDTTSRSPTERNAVDMPVSAAAAEAW